MTAAERRRRFCGTSCMVCASAASRRSVLWFGVLIRRDEHASPGYEMHVEGDGARARHGKRGGQPLTARGGTAASCLQWGGCVRALANREYPEVNHPEVTREKGGKSVTESPTAVRIHIWIRRDRETASEGNRIATHARPPIWHIGFRHCIVAGVL